MTRVASIFSQLLNHLPRHDFESLVRSHGAEYQSKGFSSWTQLVAMLFCHLGRADSLRDICNGLINCMGKMVHLGIGRAPVKSTLAYANQHRPAKLFEDFFYATLHRFQSLGMLGQRKTKFRFKNRLLSMDASVIVLCLALFPWANYRRTKGGIKLHVLLDHDGYIPIFVHVTDARRHESTIAKSLTLPPNSIVAIDMGYTDYRLYGDWTRQGVYFVSRLKDNALYEVIEKRTPAKRSNILYDRVIRLTGAKAAEKCPFPLRMIGVWDAENEREIVLLTNLLEFGATTIAAIYKERWQIELFFKAIKQNLRIKTFVGTSKNALYTQIWTALIAILMLKIMALRSKLGWSLSTLVALLRWNLFAYRDLWEWVDNPYGPPPFEDLFEQPSLFDNALGQHLTRPQRGALS